MKIFCDYCKKEFNRKPSEICKNNYCCKECYKNAISEKKELHANYKGGKYVKCKQCGKDTYKTPSQLENNKHSFCSIECLGKWRSENLTGENASNYKNALIHKICPICNKEFTTYDKIQVCCSSKCGNKNKEKQLELKCEYCKETFTRQESYVYWHNIRGLDKMFCSNKCKNKYYTGENNPKYIKDRFLLKDNNHSIRQSKEMSDWRKSVYKRDDYTCQMCGNKSSKGNHLVLNAHHIERFVDNKDLIFDVNNGITLCECCHKLTYRKEKEFEEQFKNIVNKEHISPRQKYFYGFMSGDMVKAIVTKGKKIGTYIGTVACRSTGSFDINLLKRRVQSINYKYCQIIQKSDGYKYIIKRKQEGDSSTNLRV